MASPAHVQLLRPDFNINWNNFKLIQQGKAYVKNKNTTKLVSQIQQPCSWTSKDWHWAAGQRAPCCTSVYSPAFSPFPGVPEPSPALCTERKTQCKGAWAGSREGCPASALGCMLQGDNLGATHGPGKGGQTGFIRSVEKQSCQGRTLGAISTAAATAGPPVLASTPMNMPGTTEVDKRPPMDGLTT